MCSATTKHPLAFPWMKASKVAQMLSKQARARARAESLSKYHILHHRLTDLILLGYADYQGTLDFRVCHNVMYIALRVMHFSAFINPQRACAGGLLYLSCLFVCYHLFVDISFITTVYLRYVGTLFGFSSYLMRGF